MPSAPTISGFCTPARTTRPKEVFCNSSHRPAMEAAEQGAFDHYAEQGNRDWRDHERPAEAEIGRKHKGEIGADRIKRAVGEIDDAAEREDQRQAKRDQQVIDAVKQPVEDLLR